MPSTTGMRDSSSLYDSGSHTSFGPQKGKLLHVDFSNPIHPPPGCGRPSPGYGQPARKMGPHSGAYPLQSACACGLLLSAQDWVPSESQKHPQMACKDRCAPHAPLFSSTSMWARIQRWESCQDSTDPVALLSQHGKVIVTSLLCSLTSADMSRQLGHRVADLQMRGGDGSHCPQPGSIVQGEGHHRGSAGQLCGLFGQAALLPLTCIYDRQC